MGLTRVETVRILMISKLIQAGKLFAAHVTAIGQICLVGLDVIQIGVQILEDTVTSLQYTFVDLKISK